MAIFPFGDLSVILDRATNDTVATVAFNSTDCDADFNSVKERGATVLEAPAHRQWGARAAYIEGPGALVFEIEQVSRAGG